MGNAMSKPARRRVLWPVVQTRAVVGDSLRLGVDTHGRVMRDRTPDSPHSIISLPLFS